jgi:hypothetical protein
VEKFALDSAGFESETCMWSFLVNYSIVHLQLAHGKVGLQVWKIVFVCSLHDIHQMNIHRAEST